MERYHVQIGDAWHEVTLKEMGGRIVASVEGREYDLESLPVGEDALSIREGNRSLFVHLAGQGQDFRVKIRGAQYQPKVLSDREWHFRNLGGAGSEQGASALELRAPMPGKVLELKVAVGDRVEKGTPLVILEAMKMENELKSSGPAVVAEISVLAGQAVEGSELLLRFEAADEGQA